MGFHQRDSSTFSWLSAALPARRDDMIGVEIVGDRQDWLQPHFGVKKRLRGTNRPIAGPDVSPVFARPGR